MKRAITLSIVGLVCFIAYCMVRGPLQNAYYDQPFVVVFLPKPGIAAMNAAITIGFVISAWAMWKRVPLASIYVLGFGCLMIPVFLDALFRTWQLYQGPKVLYEIFFENPTNHAIWKWYSWLKAPQLIGAIGFLIIIAAATKQMQKTK